MKRSESVERVLLPASDVAAPPQASDNEKPLIALGATWLLFAFVLLTLYTKPLNWGDTIVYAPQIVSVANGSAPSSQLWEFGHLFWRPMGELFWHLSSWFWLRGNKPVLAAYSALRLIDLFFGLIATFAAYAISLRISKNVLAATFLSSVFIGWNAFINYFQTGNAYVPGLAMQLVGLVLLLGGPCGQRPMWRAWCAGVALALSVCLWFPYVLGVPGVLVLGYFWECPPTSGRYVQNPSRLKWILNALLVCTLAGIISYSAGIWLAHIRTFEEIKAWVVNAQHGWHPDRSYFRVATGLPRGLVDLGQYGLTLKQFFFHDPYARIGAEQLFQRPLLNIVFFYAVFACLLWTIYRDKEARFLMWSFSINWAFLMAFAIFLFEPSTPERWMPGFVTLFSSFSFMFRRNTAPPRRSLFLGLALATISLGNIISYATPAEPGVENLAVRRLRTLKPVLVRGNMITLPSFNDDIGLFVARFPLHSSRPVENYFYWLTEPSTVNSGKWAKRFASRALKIWEDGGEIWLSKRLNKKFPDEEWGWAEGDDPNLRWREIPQFFNRLSCDKELGDDDGFLRLARTPDNEAYLRHAAE